MKTIYYIVTKCLVVKIKKRANKYMKTHGLIGGGANGGGGEEENSKGDGGRSRPT